MRGQENKENKERAFALWLCSLPGVGDRTAEKLLQHFGTWENVYRAKEEEITPYLRKGSLEAFLESREKTSPMERYRGLQERGIGFVIRSDKEYPDRLREIPDPPQGIFYRGRLPDNRRPAVAVIGARDCSEYGRYVASELGRELGRRGISVISGMARGIDGISQEKALETGGVSYGVLGCGVDICYPRQNRPLYDRLLQEGGLLSSYVPGTPPLARNFPPRNRIVSGLADALVVIEARDRSGTLITVDMALEQGKEVYVVPGRVTDRLSDGCNRLLKQGAGVFLSPEEFLRELSELTAGRWKTETAETEEAETAETETEGSMEGTEKEPEEGTVRCGPDPLAPELVPIYRALDLCPLSVEQIGERVKGGLDERKLSLYLMQLCMLKRAVQVSPGHFRRVSP